MYLHWADDIMRLKRPLAHLLLHLVPLSTVALEKEQSDSGGEYLAPKCPWHEPCFDEDKRNVCFYDMTDLSWLISCEAVNLSSLPKEYGYSPKRLPKRFRLVSFAYCQVTTKLLFKQMLGDGEGRLMFWIDIYRQRHYGARRRLRSHPNPIPMQTKL